MAQKNIGFITDLHKEARKIGYPEMIKYESNCQAQKRKRPHSPESVADGEQRGGEVPACFTLSIPLHEDVGDVVAGALQDTGLNNLRGNKMLSNVNYYHFRDWQQLYFFSSKVFFKKLIGA